MCEQPVVACGLDFRHRFSQTHSVSTQQKTVTLKRPPMPQGKFESGETKIVTENKPVTKRDSSKFASQVASQEESQHLDSI